MKVRIPNTTLLKNTTRFQPAQGFNQTLVYFKSVLHPLLFVLFISFSSQSAIAQCDAEVSGVFAYCNSFIGNNQLPGYFIGFRIKSLSGDTLNVVDLAGNVPTNLGKRINDINNQQEPSDTSRVPIRIAGGIDSLEFWYFGPFMDGDSFNIVLVDPSGVCDTIFVASGTFSCQGQDPNACGAEVPLYIMDFSESSWNQGGGGGGGNENVDDVFLVMSRERKASCCFTGTANERCFEFIITFDEDDIGIVIDDVGSGSTGGKIYADSLAGFACGPTVNDTWPFIQDNGNSADVQPICLFASAREWIVLTCKQGANITSASIGTVGSPNVLPEFLYADCMVEMDVLNADSAVWMSPDDPNLDNLINFTDKNLSVTFQYDTAVFGQITECMGDTFVYIVGGFPFENACLSTDSLVSDTTFIVVFPTFYVNIDTVCSGANDSLLLTATITSAAEGCNYDIRWSTGDTTMSIYVPNVSNTYYVDVTRSDLDSTVVNCVGISDTIDIQPAAIACQYVPDLYFDCIEDPPASDTSLIGVGGCGLNPYIYTYDTNNGGIGCPYDTLIIVRYYVVDFDGDSLTTTDRDSCAQRFIYIDNIPPVLIGCPPNITIQCTSSTLPNVTGGPPTASDNCDANPVVNYTDVIAAGSCPQESTITRTWRATDLCGNSSTCVQIILVDDSTPPAITCPPNLTINCTANTLPASTGTATATDICDSSPTITFTDVIVSGTCPQQRTINRTWRATDDCVNFSTCLQTITIIDNTAPVITCPPNITIQCSANTNPTNTGSATATDNCDLSVIPVVLSNVVVEGSCPQQSTITRTWRATDDCGNSTTCVQTITLVDNVAPVITCPANITIQCTASTSPATTGSATAIDNCDATVSMTYTDVSTDGSCPQERTITRTWRAADDCGNFSTCTQVIVVDDSTSPAITCPPDITISCTANTLPVNTGTATATDNCSATVGITYTEVITPSMICSQEFTITRTWRAIDECGNIGTCNQIITIDDSVAPVITCPPGVTIECGDNSLPSSTGTATATDICDATPTVSYTDEPGEGECISQFVINRIWIATDDCGNSSTCVQLIEIIDDIPPVISCPANITIDCEMDTSSGSTGSANATDNCSSVVISQSQISTQNPDVNACDHYNYLITRTWLATDQCGNSSSCIQTIQVQDTTPPEISCAPIVSPIECPEVPQFDTAIATDNCDNSVDITFSMTTIPGLCDQEYSIIGTWTATDACGNSAECSDTIVVVDNLPPVINCPEVVSPIACTDVPDFIMPTATDLCDTSLTFTLDTQVISGTHQYGYSIIGVWTATDDCGNSSTCSQTIVVLDTIAPLITCPQVTSVIECPATPDFGTATASDNCDSSVVISFTTVTIPGSCPQEYSMVRTWTATDDYGNSSSCSRTIVVEDNTPPVINCPTVNSPIHCPSNPVFPAATAVDACDPSVPVFFSTVVTPGPCPQERTITRTWTATDDCGNSTTCSRSVVVVDDTPPVITCPAVVSPIDCSSTPVFGNATATDACDATVTITFTEITIPGDCAQEYSITRIWTATDDCGNSSTCSRTIDVVDNTPPIITCPEVVSPVDCSETAIFGTATANDACDNEVEIIYTTDTIPGSCPQEFSVMRTWTATDDCGNVAICSRTIIVKDTISPTLFCVPDTIINCGLDTSPVSTGFPTSNDACDLLVAITYDDEILIGDCLQEYTINRSWLATDDCGNTSACIQVITVQDTTVPVIVCPGDTVINCTENTLPANTGVASGSDNCDTAVAIGFSDSIINGSCEEEYTINRTWLATDNCGNTSECVQVIMVQDTTVPVITCSGDTVINCTENTLPVNTGFASGLDNCDTAVAITFSDSIINGACQEEYTINRTWIATDNCGNTSECVQVIMVQDTTVPVITCPADTVINCTENTLPANTGFASGLDNCDTAVAIAFSDSVINGSCQEEYTINRTWLATDNCGNTSECLQVIMVQDTTVPGIVCPVDTVINCTENTLPANTGFASGLDNCDTAVAIAFSDSIINGSCEEEYTINRTWLATDNCGNTSECLQVIMVQDTTVPVIVCPVDTVINCTENTLPADTGFANGSDNCDTSVIIVYSDSLINGSCVEEYTINRTWVATDNCGNTSACLQIIMVQDTTVPVISCPADTIINCTENSLPANTGFASGSDNCDTAVLIVFSDSIVNGSCQAEYTINRTWLGTDNCGNTSECIQVIFVQDTTAPIITCPADITVDYPASTLPANTGSATAVDLCDTSVAITYLDSLPPLCNLQNLIHRTWIATDDCGNSSYCIQQILIEDAGNICGVVEDDLGVPLDSILVQLIADVNGNEIYDAGDTVVASVLSDTLTGSYCFNNVRPCDYLIVEVQPVGYGDLEDYDYTPDPDGDDSAEGPDNEIPVVLDKGENDHDNNLIDIFCPSNFPSIPPDTICEDGSVIFVVDPMDPGPLTYTWDFGSGATPATATGLGPHTVSYVTTTNNQMGGAIVSLTISKPGCPSLIGQVSTVVVNPYPNSAINSSTSNICYYTNKTFQPVAAQIPGATYTWTFGNNAVPLTATGYGPHTVYYTASGTKNVKLVIHPNAAGAQCPDSSTLSFNVISCPGNITGSVKSTAGGGIQGVNLRLFADANQDGVADNSTIIRNVNTTVTGSYSMVSLTPGSYVIIQIQPPLWVTVDDEDTSNDGDAVGNIDSLDNLIPATVNPSEIDAHNIFTESPMPGNISGSVFNDSNGDEDPDAGEGIEGVVINLFKDFNKDGQPDTGTPLDTTVTSASGIFAFFDVPVGNYVLEEIQPSGYISIKDLDATNDQDSVPNTNTSDDLIPVTITNQENDQNNYFIEEYECSLLVLNTNDSGSGSLRFLIDCASDGDTIRFDTSLEDEVILLTSEKIEIDKSIVIESLLSPRVTISSEIEGIFDIGINHTVEFRNLDIISGITGNNGAAFQNFGILKLHNINVYRNILLPPDDNLILNSMGSELYFSGSSYLGN